MRAKIIRYPRTLDYYNKRLIQKKNPATKKKTISNAGKPKCFNGKKNLTIFISQHHLEFAHLYTQHTAHTHARHTGVCETEGERGPPAYRATPGATAPPPAPTPLSLLPSVANEPPPRSHAHLLDAARISPAAVTRRLYSSGTLHTLFPLYNYPTSFVDCDFSLLRLRWEVTEWWWGVGIILEGVLLGRWIFDAGWRRCCIRQFCIRQFYYWWEWHLRIQRIDCWGMRVCVFANGMCSCVIYQFQTSSFLIRSIVNLLIFFEVTLSSSLIGLRVLYCV